MLKRQIRHRRIRRWQIVPPIWIEDVGRVTPERRTAVDRVGVHGDDGAGRDVVTEETIVGGVLADVNGDDGDVAEGFAVDVVEVWEAVLVDGGEAAFVAPGLGGEEKGHVLANLAAESVLHSRVFGEQVEGPSDGAGSGVMSGAEECHDLVSHRFEGHVVVVVADQLAARGGIVAHD